MISGGKKREIEDSIRLAFDKYFYQHYQDVFSKLNFHQDVNVNRIDKEDRFFQKRELDINSYIYMLRKRSKSKIIRKHRAIITRTAIISLAKGSFALSELDHEKRSRDGNSPHPDDDYTDRQKQRLLNERYRDVFFETGSSPQESSDGRAKSISSVFSENMPPSTPASNFTLEYLETAYDASFAMSDQLFLNSFVRFAFPEFLNDILSLRDECKAVFENLGEHNERIDFLREQLTEVTPLLITFYSNLSAILDLEWFRSRPKNTQKKFLESNAKIRYHFNDATIAREILCSNWSPTTIPHILSVCGIAFLHLRRFQSAIHLFKQCLNVAEEDLGRGQMWQNIAVVHRQTRNFKLALGAMRKALPFFKTTGDTFRICTAIQLIGESQWHLGFKDSAMKSFGEIEEYGREIKSDERWRIQYILAMSFGRLGEWTIRKKHLTKALALIPEWNTNAILRLNRLIDYELPIFADAALRPALEREISDFVRRRSVLFLDDS